MKQVFELHVYVKATKNYPLLLEKIAVPVVFSSRKKAEKYIKLYTKEKTKSKEYEIHTDKNNQILYFEIKATALDSFKNATWDVFFYNEKGKLIKSLDKDFENQSFPGVSNPKFKPGDLVQFFSYGEIKLGVIYAQPLSPKEVAERNLTLTGSDDAYLIDELEGEHDHISEEFISKPRYPVTKAQLDLYGALQADVLLRVKNKDRNGPKFIPATKSSKVEA